MKEGETGELEELVSVFAMEKYRQMTEGLALFLSRYATVVTFLLFSTLHKVMALSLVCKFYLSQKKQEGLGPQSCGRMW